MCVYLWSARVRVRGTCYAKLNYHILYYAKLNYHILYYAKLNYYTILNYTKLNYYILYMRVRVRGTSLSPQRPPLSLPLAPSVRTIFVSQYSIVHNSLV